MIWVIEEVSADYLTWVGQGVQAWSASSCPCSCLLAFAVAVTSVAVERKMSSGCAARLVQFA